ncbi:MAG TPA: hypothetical protein VK001_02195 [Geminicoccaceae bacterium]|nr:hypothetical protein [Geminicoccaceae bacterium]
MMALLGKGALVIWHDPAPEAESDYNEWHSKEHMFERVGLPGFRRGQRAVAISGAPKYFNLYEVDDVSTLESEAYLDRLNDPTPWTRRVVPHLHNNSRTLCRITASCGAGGVPAFWIMILLSPAAGRATELRRWLAEEALPGLVERPGILGGHLVEGERTRSGTDTAEKRLRSGDTEFVDWVILVGGYDGDALASVRSDALSEEILARHGAASSSLRGLYRLVHCVTEADVPS